MLVIIVLSLIVSILRRKFSWLIAGLILGFVNIFTAQFLNAWFLNKFGIQGTAVVTQVVETNSTLNDQYISDYDVLVKTADGKDVLSDFSTMTAVIYPIRNNIRLPDAGAQIAVKYIPGYEKNIVILSDESSYGRSMLIGEHKQPVEKAAIQYQASPGNEEFKKEYIKALKEFIEEPANSPDSVSVRNYRLLVKTLEGQ